MKYVMFRVRMYEFLAAPAHGWLYVVAWICGGRITWGPVEDVEDEDDDDRAENR